MAGGGAPKSDAAFRTIGEMAAELGVKPHILRYWEEQFPSLRPLTRAGGRRLYRPDDAALCHRIQKLLKSGYTIRGAGRVLAGGAATEAARATSAAPLDVALRAIRDRLQAALAAS